MKLPKDVANILFHMKEQGINAYVVGGAVRDMLLGNEPSDYDMACQCTPDRLKEAFSGFRTVDNGIRYGTLTVVGEKRSFEITCTRRESGYSDLRRPDEIEFCSCIEEDLARRDFTVNAIALAPDGTLIDPYGGAEDICNGIIRTVGDPERRFGEDALRIIRALRFSSCLGFEIEETTGAAVHKNSELVLHVAGERIMKELEKLLLGKNVLNVLLEYYDVICRIVPELLPCIGFEQKNPHHVYTVYEHIARTVAAALPDKDIRLCMLFHDIAKPQYYFEDEKGVGHFWGHAEGSATLAQQILKRLRADGETQRRVTFLVKNHERRPAPNRRSLRKYLLAVDYEGARALTEVRRADILGQSPRFRYELQYLEESKRIIDGLESEGACVSLGDLCVNGKDLMDIGIPEGKGVGEMLNALLRKVAADQLPNEKEALLAFAKKSFGKK